MFKHFLTLEWKAFIRSSSFATNLAVKILMVFVAIYLPHLAIDRFSLGESWSELIHGRTKEKTLATPPGPAREFGFAFYAPVYIATDNTLHFLCLWATLQFCSHSA